MNELLIFSSIILIIAVYLLEMRKEMYEKQIFKERYETLHKKVDELDNILVNDIFKRRK